ncbi:hypothetical protein MIND_01209700 [Mycena indigotica]|uniref:Uncharacterized protein n=1 Tax=Mycena indigotica TaxID=2126181 RepID=A0A8H6VWV5_9AGAR|nr:uncharacterized protein MIND_01209700 [Mycena indigotica]KAF7293103.1 hypothetical protein MIND_01209700 [Mycena indigotica]
MIIAPTELNAASSLTSCGAALRRSSSCYGYPCTRMSLLRVQRHLPKTLGCTSARELARGYNLSLTHGFFIGMGGFVDADGHPIVTRAQLSMGHQTPSIDEQIHAVDKAAIEDKSKRSGVLAAIVLCQAAWFIVQCMARHVRRLPLAPLELLTLAFVTMHLLNSTLTQGGLYSIMNVMCL